MKRKIVVAACVITVVTGAILLGVNSARIQQEKKWVLAFGEYLAGRMEQLGQPRPSLDPDKFTFRVASSSRLKDGVIVIFTDKVNDPPHRVDAAYVSPDGRIANAISAEGSNGKMRMSDGTFNFNLATPGPESMLPNILPSKMRDYLSARNMTLEKRTATK
ncbi:MAG: hypothetical protein BWK76_28300 [Desulfobulbaceae bacterium A2]|nr:MAG: hypothetical protein BWK76_28300 [Desulfobulbaceae bacterium A2]